MKIFILLIARRKGCILILTLITVLFLLQAGYGMAGKKDIPSTHVLSEKDSKHEFVVHAGDLLEIRLRGTGGTGYAWHLTSLDEQFLMVSDTEISVSTEGKPGGPVIHIWRLKTLRTGVTEIRIDYFRAWEGIQSAKKHFSVKLAIQK